MSRASIRQQASLTDLDRVFTLAPTINFTPRQAIQIPMRNTLEFLIIILIAAATYSVQGSGYVSADWMKVLIVTLCWAKTTFFIAEEMIQLRDATRINLPYHKFMHMMLVNMFQIILSFGLDYYCLLSIDAQSFSVATHLRGAELVFECVYFSTLNFTFFGYGDITPQNVPAKLLAMTEIALAFLTVIFLLSDFISLKESLRVRDAGPSEPHV